MLEFLGGLHPIAVHFPVALVVTAAAAEILHRRSRASGVSNAARFMLAVAAPFALFAALFGFAAAGARTFGPDVAGTLDLHRVAGVAASVLTVLSAGLAESASRNGDPWRVSFYRAALVLSAAVVAIAAHFGAVLTHGPDYPLFR